MLPLMSDTCKRLVLVFSLVCNTVFGLSPDQLYTQGNKAFTAGLWRTASSRFAQFIREYPEDPRADSAAYFGAVAYYKAKDFQRCLEALRGFDGKYPKSRWTRRVGYWEGLSRYELEDWTGAAASFERQIEFDDEIAEQSLLYLGASLENLEDWKGAESAYLKLIEKSESRDLTARSIFRLGQVQLSDGKPSEALDAFTRLISEYPESPLALQSSYWIAEARKKMGERRKALEAYRGYIALGEESPYMSFALLEAARLASDARLNEEALHYLDIWEGEFQSGIEEEAKVALKIRAAIYLRMGRVEAAKEAYSSILEAPGDEDEEQAAAFNLAQTWLGTDEAILAVPYLERSIEGPDKRIAADAAFLAGGILISNRDERGAELLEDFANRYPEDERREEALRLAFAAYRRGERLGRANVVIEVLIRDYSKSVELPSYLFLRGELALNIGDSSTALHYYGIIVRNHGDSPVAIEANSRIGFIYSERREYIRAAGYYVQAAEAGGGVMGGEAGRRAAYSAAIAYLNGGMNAEAIELLDSIVESDPMGAWSIESVYYLGEAYYDEEDYAEAREAYRKVAHHADGEFLFDALYGIGWTWFRQSEWNSAAGAFEDAAKVALTAEQRAKAHFRVAMSLASGGNWEEALPSYENALLVEGEEWREEVLYQKAWALLNLNRVEEANRTARIMSEEFPNSSLPADLPFRMGENAMKDGRFVEAIRWYDRTLVQYPNTDMAIRAELRAALAARENGDVVDASKRYGAWIINHPENPSASAAIRSWAQMLKSSGNSSLAVDAKSKIMDSLGNNLRLSAPIILAWARLVQPDSTALLQTIAEDESLPPADRSEALLLVANSYFREGRVDRSREIYEVLVREVPGRIGAEAQEGIARTYLAEGRLDEAAEAYMAIPYLFPNQEDLSNHALGEAERLFRGAGRIEEADKIREGSLR